jgi:outer membrane murein-binding lipoprotein Lpp
MYRLPTLTTAILSTLMLAGCNSAGTETAATPAATLATSNTRMPHLNNAKLNALFDANKSLAVTPIGTLPPSGSASYNGFAELVSPASVMTGTTGGSAVGVAALEVDFGTATNAMTGTITDFDDTTGTYDGTLNVTGGSISSITGNLAATSDIAGTLTRSSGEVINVAGKVGGVFYGPNGVFLQGSEKVTVSSGGQNAVTDIFLTVPQ